MSERAVVYVVDDDASVRDSLRRLLASVGLTVQVFGSAHAFLEERRSSGPACLILDVEMPDLSGIELQQRIADSAASLPIIFLTGHGDIPMSVRAIKAGAMEFLTKPFQVDALVNAVRHALNLDRELGLLRARYESLTLREREVLRGVIAGMLNKQIAARFGTREATVKEQRDQVTTKMAASSVADLVRIAARLGIEPLDDSDDSDGKEKRRV